MATGSVDGSLTCHSVVGWSPFGDNPTIRLVPAHLRPTDHRRLPHQIINSAEIEQTGKGVAKSEERETDRASLPLNKWSLLGASARARASAPLTLH